MIEMLWPVYERGLWSVFLVWSPCFHTMDKHKGGMCGGFYSSLGKFEPPSQEKGEDIGRCCGAPGI